MITEIPMTVLDRFIAEEELKIHRDQLDFMVRFRAMSEEAKDKAVAKQMAKIQNLMNNLGKQDITLFV